MCGVFVHYSLWTSTRDYIHFLCSTNAMPLLFEDEQVQQFRVCTEHGSIFTDAMMVKVKGFLVPRFRALWDRLHERGTHHWLLAVPIHGLQQTLSMRHFRALLRYRLCMHMFPAYFKCPSYQAPMDAFGDHALLCSSDSRSGGFQLRHSLVQRSLGIILQQAGVYHLVEPPHFRLERDDAPASV